MLARQVQMMSWLSLGVKSTASRQSFAASRPRPRPIIKCAPNTRETQKTAPGRPHHPSFLCARAKPELQLNGPAALNRPRKNILRLGKGGGLAMFMWLAISIRLAVFTKTSPSLTRESELLHSEVAATHSEVAATHTGLDSIVGARSTSVSTPNSSYRAQLCGGSKLGLVENDKEAVAWWNRRTHACAIVPKISAGLTPDAQAEEQQQGAEVSSS